VKADPQGRAMLAGRPGFKPIVTVTGTFRVRGLWLAQ